MSVQNRTIHSNKFQLLPGLAAFLHLREYTPSNVVTNLDTKQFFKASLLLHYFMYWLPAACMTQGHVDDIVFSMQNSLPKNSLPLIEK